MGIAVCFTVALSKIPSNVFTRFSFNVFNKGFLQAYRARKLFAAFIKYVSVCFHFSVQLFAQCTFNTFGTCCTLEVQKMQEMRKVQSAMNYNSFAYLPLSRYLNRFLSLIHSLKDLSAITFLPSRLRARHTPSPVVNSSGKAS